MGFLRGLPLRRRGRPQQSAAVGEGFPHKKNIGIKL